MKFPDFGLGRLRSYLASWKKPVPKQVLPAIVQQTAARPRARASGNGYSFVVRGIDGDNVTVRLCSKLGMKGVLDAPYFDTIRLTRKQIYGVCPGLKDGEEIKVGAMYSYDRAKFFGLASRPVKEATDSLLAALADAEQSGSSGADDSRIYTLTEADETRTR